MKAVAVLTLTAASIQAGVIYNLVGSPQAPNFPSPLDFQLTVPNFINAPVDSPLLLFSCSVGFEHKLRSIGDWI
jgi:hypothetical protein